MLYRNTREKDQHRNPQQREGFHSPHHPFSFAIVFHHPSKPYSEGLRKTKPDQKECIIFRSHNLELDHREKSKQGNHTEALATRASNRFISNVELFDRRNPISVSKFVPIYQFPRKEFTTSLN
jgi:hypothetical protein